MKVLNRSKRAEEGSTLMMAVIPMIVLSVALIAALELAMSRTTMTVRSQAWNTALSMSEAGVEEGMAHLNYTEGANLARFGWTLTSGQYFKSNNFGDGSYAVWISTNTPSRVTSAGYAKLPASLSGSVVAVVGNQASVQQRVDRDVEVLIKRVPPMIGLVSKGKMTVQNDFDVDSYDSSDPAYSSNGVYVASRAKANGFVGTISTVSGDMLVKDNAQIRGNVGAGANGVISLSSPASVGDATWVTSQPGRIQAGHQQNNLTANIPNFALPSGSWSSSPSGGMYGGVSYTQILTNRDYRVAGTLTLDGSKKMLVTGRARLYVTSTIYVKDTAYIEILPGASLEVYVGQQIYVQGGGKINANGKPEQFLLVGLSTVAECYFQDNAVVSGIVHTPQAKLDISGDAQFYGAGNANEIVLHGSADFHFDEALSTTRKGVFQITNWREK